MGLKSKATDAAHLWLSVIRYCYLKQPSGGAQYLRLAETMTFSILFVLLSG